MPRIATPASTSTRAKAGRLRTPRPKPLFNRISGLICALQAHFDGSQIRLDEPFEIPANSPLMVTVLPLSTSPMDRDSQAIGRTRNRPVVVLRAMPPHGDALVCGVSTRLRQAVVDFDEIVHAQDADFSMSDLKAPTLIRLGFLGVRQQPVSRGRLVRSAPSAIAACAAATRKLNRWTSCSCEFEKPARLIRVMVAPLCFS